MNVAILDPTSKHARRGKPVDNNAPVWDSRLQDRSPIFVACRPEHTRKGSPTDYAPARDVPIPPEKSSGRSTCYYFDPTDGLIKVAESQLELNATLRFLADHHVRRIEPQFGPVFYNPLQGKRTHTVFDLRVTYDTEAKNVVSVKRASKAHQLKTDELNQLILDQMPTTDADFAQLVTERDLPQWALANFRLIHSVRNDRYWLCDTELRQAAKRLLTPLTIDEFTRPWGGAKAVFRTAIMLIFDGTLRQSEPGEIDENTLVVGGNKEQAS